jgi:hypothetical protein
VPESAEVAVAVLVVAVLVVAVLVVVCVAPSEVAVDVAAPSGIRMAIAVWDVQATVAHSGPKASASVVRFLLMVGHPQAWMMQVYRKQLQDPGRLARNWGENLTGLGIRLRW